MEAQQQQQPVNNHEDGGVGNNMKNTPPPSFLCRQSSTRWTPTTDQIRILKELYYNNGVRSPSADQIQRISARLRQYGKIEGKNVFYWFQNHKARERQKKRFTTTDHHIPPPSFQRNNNNAIKPAHWRSSEDHPNIHNNNNNNYHPPNMINPPGVVQYPPPPGVFAAVGQMGRNCGYGSAAMEMSFRECSISPKDHINCGSIGQAPSYSSIPCPHPFLDKIKSIGHDDGQEDQQEEDDDVACGEIETLPLFPMHGEEEYYSCHGYNIKPAESSRGHNYYNGWYQSDDVNSFGGSSLELSLNSYITGNGSTDHFY